MTIGCVDVDSAELMPPPPLPTASEGPPPNKGPSIPAVTTRVVLLKVCVVGIIFLLFVYYVCACIITVHV